MSVLLILADTGLPNWPWLPPALKILLVTAAVVGTLAYSGVYLVVTMLATLRLHSPTRKRAKAGLARGVLGAVAVWGTAIAIHRALAKDAALWMLSLVPIVFVFVQITLWALVVVVCFPRELQGRLGWKLELTALAVVLILYFTVDAGFLMGAFFLLAGVAVLFPAMAPLLL